MSITLVTLNGSDFPTIFHSCIDRTNSGIDKSISRNIFPFISIKNFPFKSRYTGDVFFTSFTFPSNFRDKRQSLNESCVYNQLKIPPCEKQIQFYHIIHSPRSIDGFHVTRPPSKNRVARDLAAAGIIIGF